MKYKKEQIYGMGGSLLFGLLLIVFLYLMVIKPNMPDDEAGGGMEVNFGNVEFSSGNEEPSSFGEDKYSYNQNGTGKNRPYSESKEKNLPEKDAGENKVSVHTQNTEETISLPEYKKNKTDKEKTDYFQKEKTKGNLRGNEKDEYAKKREAINRQMAGSFGTGRFKGGSEGTSGSGRGNQGSIYGNSDKGPYHGIGGEGRGKGNGRGNGSGNGNGIGSFSLQGRTLVGKNGLPRPSYTAQEEGRIVINITVNPQGRVIYAEIGRGTNIDNASMRNSALNAAKRATFSLISGNNNQSGTITYKYKLN